MTNNNFRAYGEDFFGKPAMDMISDAEIEEAELWATHALAELTDTYGPQDSNVIKELFCNYIFGQFM